MPWPQFPIREILVKSQKIARKRGPSGRVFHLDHHVWRGRPRPRPLTKEIQYAQSRYRHPTPQTPGRAGRTALHGPRRRARTLHRQALGRHGEGTPGAGLVDCLSSRRALPGGCGRIPRQVHRTVSYLRWPGFGNREAVCARNEREKIGVLDIYHTVRKFFP